ncbi:Uncharacterized serpin-like protein MA_3388 (modular protein) [groundwater metagenome]|uniref:Uncharacterized serpin-like protein MA_3388 (Modular protein) n=1 Tax=groundwater metagenome TaxID=717931 RepID=A0A098EA57_9ZZZZ
MEKKSKNLSIALIIASIAIIWAVLLSGCVENITDKQPQILNLTMCSDVINPYNDSRFLLPKEETYSFVFNESSEIYVCGNITTLINGNPINIEIYKIFDNQSFYLNISIPEKYNDVTENWDCINMSLLLLKEGEYKLRYILGGGKNKQEKDISFKILKTQQNQSGISEKSCNVDSDCACGIHIKTGACFYGNKNFVDTTKQCPDFCTGIAGNFEIKCIDGECKQINKLSNDSSPKPTPIATDVVEANNRFTFDLYSKFKNNENNDDNIFFSPYSISTALAMTYEGARGKTADEMQNVLHLHDDKEKIHSDFVCLNKELNKANKSYNLSVANALWAQKDYKFSDEYFKTIEQYYGGNVTNLDFVKDTEKSRQTINNWVENQTNNKIKNLIPEGVLDDMTRLVLTNAIYFKGTWKWEFDKHLTYEEYFHITPTKSVKIQMMYMKPDKDIFNYIETDKLQILELPYKGDKISMLILLPKENYTLDDIKENLTSENFENLKKQMHETKLDEIYIPKFKFETKYFMEKTLRDMGMPTAFSIDADFSGMTGKGDLFISAVIHQAFVDVNEEGTEAAAATGVVMMKGAAVMQLKIFKADHPFIFIIQDKEKGNILFLGRVSDPGKN